ncbi:MAG: hypothetical protein COA45_05935 [Zetaproteobacteria bacterium]|nr:MAG: hypothetical protein COA45_05935 [Zetaproteobacteria bacterium]
MVDKMINTKCSPDFQDKSVVYRTAAFSETISKVEELATERLKEYHAALKDRYGDVLLGIEDEFVVSGIHHSEYDAVKQALHDKLSQDYPTFFSSMDNEHPLMRVLDSIKAGQNQALHMPRTFRLELVMKHDPEGPEDENHLVRKANALTAMRRDIEEFIENYNDEDDIPAAVSWNPRPVPDIYSHLMQVTSLSEDEILEDIKQQVIDRGDIIGADRILAVQSLDELLLGEDPPINNYGAAGSGVHLNLGFVGKEMDEEGKPINPFYNADEIDIGTPVTWNASAGLIEVISQSELVYNSLPLSSWQRLGNRELSAPTSVQAGTLKKHGAVITQSPFSKEFYEHHNVPYKMIANEKNVHIELRNADGGCGPADGSALILTQLATTLGAVHYGLNKDAVYSHEDFMSINYPLSRDYDESASDYKNSNLMRQVLGEDLHRAFFEFTEDKHRQYEEVFCSSLPEAIQDRYERFEDPDGSLTIAESDRVYAMT